MPKLKRILKSTLVASVVVMTYFLVLAIQDSALLFGQTNIRSAVFLFAVFFFIGYSVNADDEKEIEKGGGT